MESYAKEMEANDSVGHFRLLRPEFVRIQAIRLSLVLLFLGLFIARGGSTTMNEQSAAPITKDQALEIARKTIATLKPGTDLVILEDKTVEKDFGWVFFYTTKKYLQTHNRSDLLPGNSPLVVERSDASTHLLSTSLPPNKAIEEYESAWRKRKTGAA
jgi:hypothetical protein